MNRILTFITLLSAIKYVFSSDLAFIITTKTVLPNDIINSVVSLGFIPKIFPAIQPFHDLYSDKSALYYGCFNNVSKLEKYDNTKFHSLTTLELSLVCSHYRAMQQFASDSEIQDNDWAIIMEDDAILVPSVNSSSAKSYFLAAINKSNEINGQEGFIYLGLCMPKCRSHETTTYLGIDCYGYCTHAYALKKFTAKSIFFKFYNKQIITTSSLQTDQVFYNYFKNVPVQQRIQSFLVGEGIVSPDNNGHFGIFFQCNRTSPKKGTSLTGNTFKPLKCFELKSVSSSLGEVMLEYAIIAEFCMSNNLQPVYCASLNKHSKELMVSNYSYELTISNLECKNPNYITIHRNVIYYMSNSQGTHTNQQLYSNNTVSNLFETNIRNYLIDIYKSTKEGSILYKSNNSIASNSNTICVCLPNKNHRNDNSTTTLQFYKTAVTHLSSLPMNFQSFLFFGDISISSESDDKVLIKGLASHFNLTITTDQIIYINEINLIRTLSHCHSIIFLNGLNNWWGAYLAGSEANVVTMKRSHYYTRSSSWKYL